MCHPSTIKIDYSSKNKGQTRLISFDLLSSPVNQNDA